MVTNQELNARREKGCIAVFADSKYFQVADRFMKRTLRRHEWQSTRNGDLVLPPATYPQRWTNDDAIVRYLKEKTDLNLPLAGPQTLFWDDNAFHCHREYLEGVILGDMKNEDDKQVVINKVEKLVEKLKTIRSDVPGVPGQEYFCPPQRVANVHWKPDSVWKVKPGVKGDFVMCHNDLNQHNIVVDPDTLEIKAIIDWEFGGFWPDFFERKFWTRPGPSNIREGEESDVQRCRNWLVKNCEEHVVVNPLLRQKDLKYLMRGVETVGEVPDEKKCFSD